MQVNKRRTKTDNVTAEFVDPEDGKVTWGHFLADEDTYGANGAWLLLKPIGINVDDDGEASSQGGGTSSQGGGISSQGGGSSGAVGTPAVGTPSGPPVTPATAPVLEW